MHTVESFLKIVPSLFTLCFILLICSGCESGDISNSNSQFPKKALQYRVFKLKPVLVSNSTENNSTLHSSNYKISYFKGLLIQADQKKFFGNIKSFAKDQNGNKVSPIVLVDGNLMSIVKGEKAVNWLTLLPDGSISSSIDINGDQVVDYLDTITVNKDHIIIANDLGLELLKNWLNGIDPLCQTLPDINNNPLFGCDGESDSDNTSMGSGGNLDNRNNFDPFDGICEVYRNESKNLLGRPTGKALFHGGHGWAHLGRVGGRTFMTRNEEGANSTRYILFVQVFIDNEGNHVYTVRETRYLDGGDTVRTIIDRVDHTGEGTRTVTDNHSDGTQSIRSSRFRTTVNENGTYETPSALADPDAPEGHKQLFETLSNEEKLRVGSWPPFITGNAGETIDPGELDMSSEANWKTWCESTEGDLNPSGIEVAAEENLGVFDKEICVDSNVSSNSGQNCITIDRSRLLDLESILEPPSANSNCGPFEEPGEDGTCGPVSGIIRLLGNHVHLNAIKLDNIEICDPLVCRSGFLD